MRTGNSGQNISIKFFSRKNKKFSLHNQYLKSTIKWIYLIGIYTCVSKKKRKEKKINRWPLIWWGEVIKNDLNYVN